MVSRGTLTVSQQRLLGKHRATAGLRDWAVDASETLQNQRHPSDGGGCNPQLPWAAGASFVNWGIGAVHARYTGVEMGTPHSTGWTK